MPFKLSLTSIIAWCVTIAQRILKPSNIKSPQVHKINQAGIDLIKKSEGCRLVVYKDIVGKPTVGYGHMSERMVVGSKITQEDADKLLEQDLIAAESAVTNNVKAPLSENQFAALVSFVFNLGAGALIKSTLLVKLNSKDYLSCAEEFQKWNHAGGAVVEDLTRRRLAEAELFKKV